MGERWSTRLPGHVRAGLSEFVHVVWPEFESACRHAAALRRDPGALRPRRVGRDERSRLDIRRYESRSLRTLQCRSRREARAFDLDGQAPEELLHEQLRARRDEQSVAHARLLALAAQAEHG